MTQGTSKVGYNTSNEHKMILNGSFYLIKNQFLKTISQTSFGSQTRVRISTCTKKLCVYGKCKQKDQNWFLQLQIHRIKKSSIFFMLPLSSKLNMNLKET